MAVPQTPIRWMRVSIRQRGVLDDDHWARRGLDAHVDARAGASSTDRSYVRMEIRTAPGPGNPTVRRAITSLAVRVPLGSSQPASLRTRAPGRGTDAAQSKLRQHAVDPIRPLIDVLEKRTQPSGGEKQTASQRRDQLRDRAAEHRPLHLTG